MFWLVRSLLDNFQLLVALFAGLFSGFFAAIFAEPIKQRFFRPNLVLEFGDSEDYKSKTPIRKNKGETEGYYVRVKVRNASTYIAKDCRAYLINVERKDENNRFVRTLYCDSIPLGWSCRNEDDKKERYGGIDIPCGINQYVDVIATEKGFAGFTPQIMVVPYRYSKLFMETGTFRFTIQVSAAGTDPTTIKLTFTWKNVWNDFQVRKDN